MITEFITYQQTVKGLAAETLLGYEKDLRHFVGWAQPQGLRWSTITHLDIDRYTQDEGARGMSARTIRKRVEVLRLIYEWALHLGLVYENPARYSQTPKIREELPKAADGAKIREYLAKPMRSAEDLQVHFLLSLILETGLRIGEALAVRGEDVDRENRCIKVRGKGAKERIVFYGKLTETMLQHYPITEGRLTYGNAREVRYMIYRTAGKFCPRIHPHAVRHTFACEQLAKGMSMKTLSTLMGHGHVSTTEIYAKASVETLGREYQSINN